MRRIVRSLPLVLAAFAALALLAACGGDDKDEAPARAMQVSMQDIAYSNIALTASKGEHIRIELDNKGQVTHDFTVDGIPMQGLHMMGGASGGDHQHMAADHAMHLALDKGQSGSLEFTPTEAGTYEFYCTVAGHRDAGMHGTLTVQ
ncbi:MAG: cupredoxin domain-containing protein [Dehalococcoidia bacterium]|nr:cupredoxin domain-containing protein [Dehalococcoidia bacterium]HRC62890.1 cupredoxin domain-containing protein [Dehalococcoidia bacterium]